MHVVGLFPLLINSYSSSLAPFILDSYPDSSINYFEYQSTSHFHTNESLKQCVVLVSPLHIFNNHKSTNRTRHYYLWPWKNTSFQFYILKFKLLFITKNRIIFWNNMFFIWFSINNICIKFTSTEMISLNIFWEDIQHS